ncbi:MAG TPA: TonB family protein [Terracidiphilus sp.]|nr:TonB family protein [Terracidiphilus sp.]
MTNLLEGTEQLEQELTGERLGAPATGSVVLHLALGVSVLLYGWMGGLFHHNLWGGPGQGGAIQVHLVSSTIPLPQTEPQNQNVLATDTPSHAAAPPTPKPKQAEDETAIPIQGKQKKIEKETVQRTPPRQVEQVNKYTAQYGEQASANIPHATQQSFSNGPTTVNNGDFGSRFGWYVNQISRTMASNWYKALVDQNTAHGARAYIDFKINRDGTVSPGDVQLERSSGSPTLDRSCLQAAQRAGNFGPLPQGYNESTLMVSYYCEY